MKLPKGFSLSGIHCGIKKRNLDLGLVYCEGLFPAVGFFTKCANVSYSVSLSRKNIKYPVRAILVNSGNANCFSHKQGLEDTWQIVSRLADIVEVKKENILIASTGIIGRKLPKEKIIGKLDSLVKKLNKSAGIKDFSKSILTTDTFTKVVYEKISLGNREVNLLGFAKGAGMICPNMATMLAFILTDADIPQSELKVAAKEAIDESFNSITVDGCMSTNDSLFLLSSRKVRLGEKVEREKFFLGLKKVCLDLAKMIVKDAEGATKFIQIQIQGAKSKQEAKKCAFAVANSNLLKCALYGKKANWGRIIAALGQAGVSVTDDVHIEVSSLRKKEVKITVDLKQGNYSGKVYTSDLTPEYVKINAL